MSTTTHNFEGRRVLVTGGAGGLGKAAVKKFLKAGATVFVVDKDLNSIKRLVEEYPSVCAEHLDLSNWEETCEVVNEFGPIHHLVNNAGISGDLVSFLDIQPEAFDNIFGVNVRAVINVSQTFAKTVINNGMKGATIVNISSALSKRTFEMTSLYSASKAAVCTLTRSMAIELAPYDIRVNAICPTFMETNMTMPELIDGEENNSSRSGVKELSIERQLLKRVLTVEETADLILYLSSSSSSMITGTDVVIDGGQLAN